MRDCAARPLACATRWEAGWNNEPMTIVEPGLQQAPAEPSTTTPVEEPDVDGNHERMAHIVLEGFRPPESDFVPAGPTVVEGMVNGTPVRALCGKVWVPGRDPRKYPLCPTCKEIAQSRGWKLPAH